MVVALSDKQVGVLKGIAVAAATTLVALPGAMWLAPPWLTPQPDFAARLAFALRWDLLPVGALLLTVGALARRRFFNPEDIDGGGLTPGTQAARVHQAVLQNTLEQVALALPVHLVWAATMPLRHLAALPVAAVLFGLGRALFWRGYAGGAPARAVGFGLTFYPTVLLFVVAALYAVTG